MLLAGVLAVALAVSDGGTPAYYRIPAGSLLDLRDGDGPFPLPAAVLFKEPDFKALDTELKRLQDFERTPPKPAVIGVSGYLIMGGIVAFVFLFGGIAIGAVLQREVR